MIYNNITKIEISKTKCPTCGDILWNFIIDNKKLDLEYFGSPFIDHICNKPDYLKDFLYIIKNVDKITDTELEQIAKNIIKDYTPSNNITKIINYELNKKILNYSFTEIEPTSNINYAFGNILFYKNKVNLYKDFNIDEFSLLAKGLLGKYSDMALDKFVLRDNQDMHNHSHQFIFYALSDEKNKELLYKPIYVNLEFVELPQNKFWLMKDYKIL